MVSAMRCTLIALGITSLTAFAAGAHASSDDRTLPYGCSDTVVVATVADSADEPAESTGNLFGDGWVSASLNVQKVVSGKDLPAVLPVRYFAQTPMRRNDEVMLVLKDTGSGYEVQAGELMRDRPVPASRCRALR